jgi:hypothetical protein
MSDTLNWPRYRSHKIVQATPIVRIDGNGSTVPLALFVSPDGIEKRFEPTEPGMMTRAEVGSYAVAYEEGFRSISPKAVFEAGYSPLDRMAPA